MKVSGSLQSKLGNSSSTTSRSAGRRSSGPPPAAGNSGSGIPHLMQYLKVVKARGGDGAAGIKQQQQGDMKREEAAAADGEKQREAAPANRSAPLQQQALSGCTFSSLTCMGGGALLSGSVDPSSVGGGGHLHGRASAAAAAGSHRHLLDMEDTDDYLDDADSHIAWRSSSVASVHPSAASGGGGPANQQPPPYTLTTHLPSSAAAASQEQGQPIASSKLSYGLECAGLGSGAAHNSRDPLLTGMRDSR